MHRVLPAGKRTNNFVSAMANLFINRNRYSRLRQLPRAGYCHVRRRRGD